MFGSKTPVEEASFILPVLDSTSILRDTLHKSTVFFHTHLTVFIADRPLEFVLLAFPQLCLQSDHLYYMPNRTPTGLPASQFFASFNLSSSSPMSNPV